MAVKLIFYTTPYKLLPIQLDMRLTEGVALRRRRDASDKRYVIGYAVVTSNVAAARTVGGRATPTA